MTSRITTADEFFDELVGAVIGKEFTVHDLAVGGSVVAVVLADDSVDTSRWFDIRQIVWREAGEDTVYGYRYGVGLTEMQEDERDEFYPSNVYAVKPVERTVTDWVKA